MASLGAVWMTLKPAFHSPFGPNSPLKFAQFGLLQFCPDEKLGKIMKSQSGGQPGK